ncbi:MAG: hypothetical protein ACRDV8_13620 [Acidimicrobiales bacterium]
MTTLVVAALVAALAYGLSGLVFSQRPAFALTASKGFTVTSTVYARDRAGACAGAKTAKLFPGERRCLAVTVHDPLAVAIDVKSLSMQVSSFAATPSNPHTTPACTSSMVRVPTLFTTAFTVGAGGTTTIDRPIRLKTTHTTQDACEDGTFTFSFSGSATFTDTTTTTLAVKATGATKAVLTATVAPSSPSSDPYGPASTTAPVHHVTFYSCGATATCATKTLLGTVTLTTTGPNLLATATYHVTGLAAGTHYYEAAYPATATHTGTFAGSTSAAKAVTLTAALHGAVVFTTGHGGSSTSHSTTTGALAFTGADIAAMTAAGVLLLALGTLLVLWERRRHRATGSGAAR